MLNKGWNFDDEKATLESAESMGLKVEPQIKILEGWLKTYQSRDWGVTLGKLELRKLEYLATYCKDRIKLLKA